MWDGAAGRSQASVSVLGHLAAAAVRWDAAPAYRRVCIRRRERGVFPYFTPLGWMGCFEMRLPCSHISDTAYVNCVCTSMHTRVTQWSQLQQWYYSAILVLHSQLYLSVSKSLELPADRNISNNAAAVRHSLLDLSVAGVTIHEGTRDIMFLWVSLRLYFSVYGPVFWKVNTTCH